MRAIITQPGKSAMQSGKAKSRAWRLTFVSDAKPRVEPLMGWTSAFDTTHQLALDFDSREAAVAYATGRGLDFEVVEPAPQARQSQAYADNFRFERKQPWSH